MIRGRKSASTDRRPADHGGDREETQAGQTLIRIESQIAELHDLVNSAASLRWNFGTIDSSSTACNAGTETGPTPTASETMFANLAAPSTKPLRSQTHSGSPPSRVSKRSNTRRSVLVE